MSGSNDDTDIVWQALAEGLALFLGAHVALFIIAWLVAVIALWITTGELRLFWIVP